MFSGSIPALVTPFRDGALDEPAFRRLVDWQIECGSSALVPCGTTGENSTLSNAEHHRVIELCIEQAAGRVPVIAGCGSNDTMNALLHMTFSAKTGAAAALLVAPYYNRPSQEGLLAHFSFLAENSDLPIVLYNVPGRTVTEMQPTPPAAWCGRASSSSPDSWQKSFPIPMRCSATRARSPLASLMPMKRSG
jgi:4-hydroxy-tetrahydrodipicolinate synthase